MTTFRYRDTLLTVAIVGIVLAAGWFAYKPALSGTFLLDDVANLGGLQDVHDTASALHFVLSGSAGPVGRPLALASFLPQADQWEQGAAPFLAVNIAIHLLNACLLGAFLYLLTRARGVGRTESRYVALAAMSLWLFMPLLASSSLMVVQRMTTLSATFVLLGLNGYLLARRLLERNSGLALRGMLAALAVATALAVLAKESGALLPVLVLVLEATLLSQPNSISDKKWRRWMALFLVLPSCLIFAYLLYRVPYSDSIVLKREFTAWERIITEARVLWEYLLNAFVPRPGQYGPYHDAYHVERTIWSSATLLAVLSWIVLTVVAIFRRRTHALFAFAVLWFVGGHMLESTTIPLELYFEHRNYVPIIGPVYALCCLVLIVPGNYRKIASAGLSLYIVVSAFFLFSFASLWGQPAMAASYWHQQFPRSVRAATAQATYQLANHGPQATLQSLEHFAEEHPDFAYIRIPALTLSCLVEPSADHVREADAVAMRLQDVRFSYTTGRMLLELFEAVSRRPCNGVDNQTVKKLARAVLSNPRYQADERYRHFHHRFMARIYRDESQNALSFEHLEKAMSIQPTAELNMMVVTMLVGDGQFLKARTFVTEAEDRAPLHPLKRIDWNRQLSELKKYIDEMERLSRQRPSARNGI